MRFRLDVDGERREIEVEPSADGFVIRIDGASYRARARTLADFVEVRIGAKRFRLRFQGDEAILDDGVHRLRIEDLSEQRPEEVGARPSGVGVVVDVRSSMPGRVIRVAVAVGARVRRGETLVVLEAMKMQNEIPSPGEGVVREVRVSAGETITADAIVASVELRGPSAS
jgi:acetyl/propionyl-CoA carboxylase alpha subunit